MNESDTEVLRAAMAWLGDDPDPETRSELADLIDRVEKGNDQAREDLHERFSGQLTFGTAGLRAQLGAGPMRMNRVVVGHAAHGLARYLVDHHPGSPPIVVIGFDARRNSDVFARDSADIMAGAGLDVRLMPGHCPTPVLAFAVRHLGADAGVMVTASHNPPADNGYKVYLGGSDAGSQIVPPADQGIHSAIIASHNANTLAGLPRNPEGVRRIEHDIVRAYAEQTLQVLEGFSAAGRAELRVCYTPLHGVGADVFTSLLDDAGFAPAALVEEQLKPDGSFPTVAFPNPEEPGALDLAYQRASEAGSDLIVAHDPDADRVAIALPARGRPGWQMLGGNEVGAILAAQIASRQEASGAGGVLACSMVSSPIARVIAEAHGLEAVETPTGFKWISRVPGLVFGFEEALGYLVNPESVRDKDGISAGLMLLAIAARLKAEGKTLWDLLDAVRARYGGFASTQISLRLASPQHVAALVAHVRSQPEALFGTTGAEIADYATPPEGQPAANLLRCDYPSGERVIVRPSGTEPKLKVYLDCLRPSQSDAEDALAQLERSIRSRIDALTGSS